ncbi:MAG: ABC transporter ATP-binding protein [Clostridiaceae bacterium]|nr:ABC transporter ATP-binding protein [Clostridiaceae bacterium]
MVKIAKFLKPFILGLVMAVVLLFVQAICEINLPNYMSDIVNVGLQQNGIEHAAPKAISEDGMKLMTTLMSESDKKLVNEHYMLVAASDKNEKGEEYSSLYPKAGSMLYVLKDVDESTLDSLDTAFGTATWTFINVMKDMAEKSGQASQEDMTSVKDVDISKLYAIQPVLDMMPEQALSSARDKALVNDITILKQSGVMLARAFYKELGVDINKIQTSYIIRVGSLMLAIALLGGVATVLVSLLSSKISSGVARNLRKELFNKIENFSNREFDKFSTASLITRCTNDVTQVQVFLIMGIRMICYAPIMGIGGVIMAVRKSVSMSWIIALACIVLIGVIMVMLSIALPKFKAIQKLVDKLNLVARENLSGMMVIRAFGTQEHEKDRFEKANDELARTTLFINRVMSFMMPFMMILMNGVTLVIVWIGAHQIAESALQVGDMMAFLQYAIQIIMSFLMISAMFIFVPRASVAAGRIDEVLKTEILVKDPENPQSFDESKKGLVEFKNVSFRYEGAEEYALTDISFTAKPGETTAIIGPTGAGKSTIAQLLLRFYDVTEGEILVDGVDIRKVRQKDLRRKIGYVPQKGILLSGTIESNIKYGRKDASHDEVETAAKVAQALDFISEKPEGFNSPIAQGGTNVSGGQKQRLSIARALATKPEIFIFDDSFSALDFRTDVALRKALKEHTGGSTVIVVAQRVSTIMNAEQILVLDEGRIVGRGTHKELLKTCPQYYEIASSQLSREELA